MPQDSDQIVIASGGSISVAPVGTTIATDPTASLAAGFHDLGFVSEEGVTFGDTPTVEEVRSWQRATATRRFVTGRAQSLSFEMQQWNDDSFVLAFGGGEWVEDGSGIYRFDPPGETDALEEQAIVVDWSDGARNFRLAAYKGSVTSGVETVLNRTSESRLPITIDLLAADSGASWNIWSDDPSFAEGGS